MPSVRDLARNLLKAVRRAPVLHGFVHGVAVAMTKTRWGERLVRDLTGPQAQSDDEYRDWVARYDTLSDDDRQAILAHIGRLERPPLISVIMSTWRSDERLLREAVASVTGQLYPHWQLCIADDASPGEDVWRVLTELAADDPRIRILRREANGGIAAATNSALSLATGEFVAFLDHDDLLAEQALYEIAAELAAHPDADLLFSDEDKIDDCGVRSQPHIKTAFDPELMLGQNAVNHLCVIRRSVVEALGGLREGFDGAQDHDLVLRVSERTQHIRHVPAVLYHWRWQGTQGSYSRERQAQCADAAARAVSEHLARTGQAAAVLPWTGGPMWLAVRRALPSPAPKVSIIVPTRDRADLLARCADGVLTGTGYPDLQLLIVDNGSAEVATVALFDRLSADPRVKVLPAPGAFNFADLNNRAVIEAAGDIVVLLNNDISVIAPDWLTELVAQAVRPNVGAVGALLLYPDDTVQHAGVVLGVGDYRDPVAAHVGAGVDARSPGYQGALALARNVSAVTAACLAIRKDVYQHVRGMDAERLPVAFNDVDLCLKVRAAGYDVIWTPRARLHHHESASRGSDLAPEAAARLAGEMAVMRERWGAVLDDDPYYGPLFDKRHAQFRLGEPPRRVPPWRS